MPTILDQSQPSLAYIYDNSSLAWVPWDGAATAFSGVLPVANGGTGTGTEFTPGSVVFAGTSGVYTQNNANFLWDNTNFDLSITGPYLTSNVSTTVPGFSFVGDADTGFGTDSADRLVFIIGGTRELLLSATSLFPLTNSGLDLGASGNRFGHVFVDTSVQTGTAPASSGVIRQSYASGTTARNRTNDADIVLLGVGQVADDDYIEIGDNSQHAVSKPLGIKFYPGSAVKLQLDTNGTLTHTGNETKTGTLTLSAMSANRVITTSTGGLLVSSADYTYNESTGALAIAAGGAVFSIGSSPATSGPLRITYGGYVTQRSQSAGGAANIGLIGMGNVADDDYIEVGPNSQSSTKPLGIKFYPGSAVKMQLDTNGLLTISGAVVTTSSLTISDTKIMKSNTTFTNGAGVGAGTLTNAPAVGNPTKWIPIDDNGTTRYIPAW